MRNIFISAGHSNKRGRDVGAVSSLGIEGELTVEFRDLLVKELKKLGINPIYDKNDSILVESLRFFKNKTSKDSIVIDIHWNSATPKATGTEVLIPNNYTNFEKKLAQDIVDLISTTLNIRSRGVKTEADSHHGRLGWMKLTGENILIEVCFLSNKNDMDSYQKNKEELAKRIAIVLFEYANRDLSTAKFYIVKKGDTLSKIARENKTTVEKIQKDNNLKSTIIQINQKLKL